MGVRCKTLVAVSATLVVAPLVVHMLAARLTVSGFREVEEARARHDVERAVAGVQGVLGQLAAKARAEASRNEARQFVQDGNQAYIDTRLSDRSLFDGIELNAIVYRHTSGRVVHAEGWPPDARRGIRMPESLLSRLTPESDLVRGGQATSGILALPEGPMLVAGSPIRANGPERSILGTLVLGRCLDARLIEELDRATGLTLSARRPDPEADGKSTSSGSAEDIRVTRLSDRTLVSSVCMKGLDGRPAIVLEVRQPHNVVSDAEARAAWRVAWTASIGVALVAALIWAVHWLTMVRGSAGGVPRSEECAHAREQLERLVQERSQSLLQAERHLFQQEKLASVGQLAAGIAHEINTPIQYIGDNLHALSSSFDDLIAVEKEYRELVRVLKDGTVTPEVIAAVEAAEKDHDIEYVIEDTPKAITQSLEGVRRVSHIVRAMKDFSHVDRGEISAVDINHALESTLTIARNEYKYVADVETDWGELPPVACYATELNQVFLNLLVNAAHAIGETGRRGKITIRTRVVESSAEVMIADTGAGIPDDIRHKIFEPFFTTKEVGKGTGQGLTIAHQIVVEKHRGSLSFESQVGEGTTFLIRIPIRSPVDEVVQGGQG